MRLISQKSLKPFAVVPLLNPAPGILNSACEGSCAVSVPCVMEEEVEKRRERKSLGFYCHYGGFVCAK